MVIYEVNITAQESNRSQFMEWLREHIVDMETVDGIEPGSLLLVDRDDPLKISVQYRFSSEAALEEYFENSAAEMRGKLPEELRASLTFSRRVLMPSS